MFLMIFIFLIVVLFNILPYFSNTISNLLSKNVFKLTNEELNLRGQVKDLKYEQSSIGMADEFARYMKIQRKIDKSLKDIKALGDPRIQNCTYVKLGVRIGIHVLHVLTVIIVVMLYKAEPLMMMSPTLFSPFQSIIALPTGIPGGLGVGCWFLLCNAIMFRAKRIFSYFEVKTP